MAGILFYNANSTPAAIGGIDGNTVLMMHMDGDQSDSQHVVTHNGDPQFSTAESKFGGSSMYFDGTGDYLTIPTSSDFDFGSGDLTIDAWVRLDTDSAVTHNIISTRTGDTAVTIRWCFYINPADDKLYMDFWNTSDVRILNFSHPTALIKDEWTHVALVRNGTNWVLFVNGIASNGEYGTGADNNDAVDVHIGASPGGHGGTSGYLKGYIDELRISKGIARWTSDFNTALPSVYTSDANTKLLLHFDGDVSTSAHVVTSNGNPQLNAATTKFDGAMYFDGAGDYISVPDHDDWNFGSGDFTVDFWVQPKTIQDGAQESINYVSWGVGAWQNAGYQENWRISSHHASNEIFVVIPSNEYGFSHTAWSTDTWYHVAMSRSGDTLRVFVDGQIIGTQDVAGVSIPTTSYDIQIGKGHYGAGDGTDYYLDGYMDELRISKGIARWTTNFTPEIGPYTE
jgi:hypothetical protein